MESVDEVASGSFEEVTPLGPRAVHRALQILTLIITHGPSTLGDLASKSELPPSTTLRNLRALEHWEFIYRGENNCYEIGPKFMLPQLELQAFSQATLSETALPYLVEVNEYTQETTYFVIPGPAGTCVYLREVESTQPVRFVGFDGWAGRIVPRSNSAVGLVFEGTVPTQGYVSIASPLTSEAHTIAAPVYNTAGGTIGAISISAPAFRLTPPKIAEFGAVIADAAARLSTAITDQDHETESAWVS